MLEVKLLQDTWNILLSSYLGTDQLCILGPD